MSAWSHATAGLLKQTGEGRLVDATTAVAREAEETRGRGRRWACAACRRPITTDAARVSVASSHTHTFANPHGFVYRIGCFATAVGVAPVGQESREFAWFPGYSWQIEQCASCGEHLGWLFRSSAHAFHGLVLDRLVEIEDESPATH